MVSEFGFRPLPGHLISKYIPEFLFSEELRNVSVPFRGISFPNKFTKIDSNWFKVFPSPSGASHFQIRLWKSLFTDSRRFRPLPGHLISKYDDLTGTRFGKCFRPLPGHLISKSKIGNMGEEIA